MLAQGRSVAQQTNMAAEPRAVGAQFPPQALHLLQHQPGMLRQRAASRCRMHAAPAAQEQGNTQHAFHAADAFACRSQCEVRAVRSARDRPRLQDIQEQPQIGQIKPHGMPTYHIQPQAAPEAGSAHSAFPFRAHTTRMGQQHPLPFTTMALIPALPGLPDMALPWLIAGVFVAAGVVKGVVGLGLPTISMALLALLMPPAQAAALLVVPSLVTNIWQTRPWATWRPMLRRIGYMQCGVCLGTLGGAWLFGAPDGAGATVALGVALMGYAAWGLAGASISVPPATEFWLGPLVGAITGLLTAATGVFVIPAVPYLQALGLRRDALVQAMGISFTVSTVALAVGLSFNASFSRATLGTSALMLLPALGGMYIGQLLRQRLSPALFRQCFLGSLAALGLYMVMGEILAR